MRRPVLAATLLAASVLVAGCDGSSPTDGKTDVVVDSPKLREMKAEAGIDGCAPGPGGGQLPDLTLACLGGGPDVNLESLRGPLLLNIWYSGCAPCRDEMPALQEFHEDNPGDVPVIGIDVETYPEAAISFAGMVGATYPQLVDPAGYVYDQADLFLTPAYPQTILVGADGSVLAKHPGEFDSASEIQDFVDAHLEDVAGDG